MPGERKFSPAGERLCRPERGFSAALPTDGHFLPFPPVRTRPTTGVRVHGSMRQSAGSWLRLGLGEIGHETRLDTRNSGGACAARARFVAVGWTGPERDVAIERMVGRHGANRFIRHIVRRGASGCCAARIVHVEADAIRRRVGNVPPLSGFARTARSGEGKLVRQSCELERRS